MQFVPRKGVKVDYEIKRMIDEMVITIPIIHIKDKLYLVGIQKIHMDMKAEDVIAQIGGGYEKFELYIKKQHKILERGLIIKMIQSKESLEWICDALIRGTKIPNNSAITYDSSTNYYQDMGKNITGSRIQIQKRPSQRVNKQGLMVSPSSPLRMSQTGGFSPKMSSRGSRSPIKSPSSPYRKSKITSSPSPRRIGTAGSPGRDMDMQVQKQIQNVKHTYDKKKSDVLSQIEVNKGQRFEHISNKDQNVVKFNQGKYSYIHKK